MASEADWVQRAFEERRRELHVHCYRLAGNVADADDLVQETFLRAWRARASYEQRASARTWLYRIATNAFLDSRKAASRRTIPSGDPLEWSTDIGPYPDQLSAQDPQGQVASGELVELALIAALTHLPPRQRAAFVLRDIHGWSPAEIAETLDVAVAATNSLLQRARATVRQHAPSDPADWRRPELTGEDEEVLRRYAAATDADSLAALVTSDIRITMPPDPWLAGLDDVVAFLLRPLDWRHRLSSANGRPALINYLRAPGSDRYVATTVDLLRIRGGRVAEINAFVGAHHVAAFGLPSTLEPESGSG